MGESCKAKIDTRVMEWIKKKEVEKSAQVDGKVAQLHSGSLDGL